MTFRRIDPGEKKSCRFTVLMSPPEMERLTRVAAYHNLTKSVMANRLIVSGLSDAPGVSDAELEEAEAKDMTWRERMGL